MPKITRWTAACSMLVALLATAAPAENPLPRTSIVQRGANRFLEDTQYMMSLTPEGRQQWPNVKGFFEDIFLLGIDRGRPLRIDVMLGDGPARYRPSFPVGNEKQFLQNLEDFGIEQRKRATGYWQLRDGFEGYLRIKDQYGSIAEEGHDTDVPATLPDPAAAIAPILAADYDLAVELVNDDLKPASMKTRAASFRRDVREEMLALVARREDEAKEDYELRRLTAEQQLDEWEWFFAESQRAVAGWTADVTTGVGTGESRLDPIPDTDLAKAVKLLGVDPSHFANVPVVDDSILSVRVNHPLDAIRKQRLADYYAGLAGNLRAKIAAGTRTDAEKAAMTEISDLVVKMFADGAAAGMADGFVEIAPFANDLHVAVAGVRSPNGKAADAIVKLLPKANPKIQVTMDKATVGNVAIHEIVAPLDAYPHLAFLFGKNTTMYLGTSKDVVWFAAGPNAMASLETAINVVDQPNAGKAEDPFVTVKLRLAPWLEFRNLRAGGKGDPELRKIVMDALADGDDSLNVEVSRDGDSLTGKLTVRDGIMRMVGRLMAKFSKENL